MPTKKSERRRARCTNAAITLLALLLLACTPHESGPITTVFCQEENCTRALLEHIGMSREVYCAFYELALPPLEELLRQKEAQVLVFSQDEHTAFTPVPARHGGLMHDKFCVLDPGTTRATVITGSMNPTRNGVRANDNNLVIITGPALAENYRAEWEELTGGPEEPVRHPRIRHRVQNRSIIIENYFCPEDACEDQLRRVLAGAKEEIRFMTFSFTSDELGELLVRQARAGRRVAGVFERRHGPYSEYERLKDAGLDVILDANPHAMHHKVFIIDAGTADATVVTGSMNPTRNGDERNDENLLIIHDPAVAQAYLHEYERIRALARGTVKQT